MMASIMSAIKVTPFVYSAVFVIVYSIYNFAGDNVLDLLDRLFYISPVVVVVMLIYSSILKFCKWHKMACALPLVPQAIDLIDSHYELTQVEIYSVNVLSVLMAIFLVICGIKVFKCEKK